jgi:hypothetical protein
MTSNSPSEDPRYVFGPFTPQQGTGPRPAGLPTGPMLKPPPHAGAPRRRSRVPLILSVLALVLIMVGVSTALLWRYQRTAQSQSARSQAPGGTSASTSPTSGPPPPALASDAVSGYLNALAAGDADAALSYSAHPVQPGPLLTNKVLVQSIKRTPLTDIQVPQVTDEQAVYVSATYRLGRTWVNASYKVVKVPSGWKLATVSNTIDLDLNRTPLPVLINGVKVTSDEVNLLPGSYAFTTPFRYLTYGSKNVLLVTDPTTYVNGYDLNVSLSARGRKTVVSLADRSYDACLRTKVPRPRNCPFAWTDSTYRYRNGSVRWRQIGDDPFKNPNVQLASRSAKVIIGFNVTITGPCVYRGTSYPSCTWPVINAAVASIRLDRKKLAVVWHR